MITGDSSMHNPFLSVNGKSFKKTLAERIKKGVEACEGRGETRQTISNRMGFETDTSLSKWVSGSQQPNPENLRKLALATGLSLDWLVAGRGPMFAPDGTEAARLQVIGRVANRTLDDETVKLLAAISGGADPDTAPLEDGLGDLGEEDGEDDDDVA